ncbi:MAG: sulfatase [Bacteroidales bacterium]|nr:sulfatase [Bacteroidales bacterium]
MDLKLRFLTMLGMGTSLTGCTWFAGQKSDPPNIIFIMSDDHAFQAISAYGGELARLAPTPNIDRIADGGIRFDRCLVTNSICGPSRATILTGKYSHLNGFTDNKPETKFDSSQQTFPKILQETGYQTAVIGKWHLKSLPTGFDFWDVLPDQGNYYNPDFLSPEGQHNETGYVTEIITKKCLDWLSKAKDSDKPFMLMMHHKAPHREWEPGPNELGMYENVTFPEPASLFDDYSNRGRAEHEQDMTISKTMIPEKDLKLSKEGYPWIGNHGKTLTPDQSRAWDSIYNPIIQKFYEDSLTGEALTRYKFQRYLRDYLACIAAVDKSVGEVLDFLKKNGLDKNTMVIYTSDQGFYLGEHGWFDKRWMFEESLRTPLLVMWPEKIDPGSRNNNMVSNLDFAETFIDVASAKIPDDMQGHSLLPVLKGKTPKKWRSEHYYHYYEYPGWHMVKRHYGITTDRYKLIHFYYDIDEWELFDLENDPHEMNNVYNDTAYGEIKLNLHGELEKLRTKYHDSDSLLQKYLPIAM